MIRVKASRILVVEDDDSTRLTLLAALCDTGYDVQGVPDGWEGLEMARTWKPDLVILDVRMPQMDGWTFMKFIQAHQEFAGLPVIFLTGLDGDKDRERGLKLGADEYLFKPVDFDVLRARVSRVFEDRARKASEQASTRAAEQSASIRGSMERTSVAALIARLGMERRSGSVVLLRRPLAQLGRILVRDGRVVRASLNGKGNVGDREALFTMLDWSQGDFTFEPCGVQEDDRVNAGAMTLMIEATRRRQRNGFPRAAAVES
jgi:DNA-binding response OmpR family regulator